MERIIEKGVSSSSMENKDMKVLELKVAIIHLPVVEVTLRYRQKLYQVTLDEVEGGVLKGQLPFRQAWAFMAGLPLTALLGWMTGRMVWGWKLFSENQSSTFPLSAIFFLFLAVAAGIGLQAALVLLKTPYQVVLHPRGFSVKKVGRTPGHPFPLLAGPVNRVVEAIKEAVTPGGTPW